MLGEGNTPCLPRVGGSGKLNANNGGLASSSMRAEGFFVYFKSFLVLMVAADQTGNKGFIMFPYMNAKA